MNATSDMLARVACQHLRTAQLLGVDFVPVRMASDEPAFGAPLSADKLALLEALRQRHDASCPHCTCVDTHTQTVFGEGSADAEIMFIGEAPGEEEDRLGRPFVGRAGKKLDEIIQAMGLQREDVYIANILKARPPNNRTPQPDEIAGCSPFLLEQIRIIRPAVIVALGGPASKTLLETDTGITRLRGSWHEFHDGERTIPVMPTFHPAYLLRNYTRDTRMQIWSDMKQVLEQVGRTLPGRK
jgi:uracil-DNA glycosylase family 4